MGFPLMGHLIWADSVWWELLFARHGLARLDAVEVSLHSKFDAAMNYSDARKSYFVLGKGVSEARSRELCEAVDRFDPRAAVEACSGLFTR